MISKSIQFRLIFPGYSDHTVYSKFMFRLYFPSCSAYVYFPSSSDYTLHLVQPMYTFHPVQTILCILFSLCKLSIQFRLYFPPIQTILSSCSDFPSYSYYTFHPMQTLISTHFRLSLPFFSDYTLFMHTVYVHTFRIYLPSYSDYTVHSSLFRLILSI